ncbi:MAG: hypothetical protein WCT45_03405 [Candidatus Paceibacterota bacterium]|jgi:hypothetical protein
MKDKIIFVGVAVLAVVVAVLLFLFGTGNMTSERSGVATTPSATSEPSGAVVPFTKLLQGNHSMVMGRVNYIVTSPSDLSELWKMVDASGKPPAVDFSKQSVIAVFAGQLPAAAAMITVSKIVDSNARTVSIAVAKPSDECGKEQTLVTPYEIILVPTTTLPLAHKDIPVEANCSR